MSLRTFLFGPSKAQKRIELRERQLKGAIRRLNAITHVTAAQPSKGSPGWQGIGAYEDSANQEYLAALHQVLQRAQDLDVNNPDCRGFHRRRVGQIIGRGVRFRHAAKHDELGLETDAMAKLSAKINRAREIHSKLGGFDASGNNRSEFKQQERSLLTAFVVGSCLIHRVHLPNQQSDLPFSLELISGARITTPYELQGDPLVSYGIRYSDPSRTRIVGYYVRRVAQSRGDSFIPDYKWDLLPADDCSLLSLTEIAGMDRALPLMVANVRTLRNQGEFLESAVETARAQAGHFARKELAAGANAWDVAADDADQFSTDPNVATTGYLNVGDGVRMFYDMPGEKTEFLASKLPDPDLPGFIKVMIGRLARGSSTTLGKWTGEVNNSFAGGRLEDQQDDPIIDQYREAFIQAWQRVNDWFLESIWLTDAVDLPGYSDQTRAMWSEWRGQFPGKVHINPKDTYEARQLAYGLRTMAPQQGCEEDGHDLDEILRLWGEAMQKVRAAEKAFGLDEGDLDFLLAGKVISTSAGGEIQPPPADTPPDPDQKPDKNKRPANRMARFMNKANA